MAKENASIRIMMLSILAVWLVVISMTYVWIQMATIQAGYRLIMEHKKQEMLIDIHKKLQVEWNYQHSPERLANMARKYGFHPPKEKERIVMSVPNQ